MQYASRRDGARALRLPAQRRPLADEPARCSSAPPAAVTRADSAGSVADPRGACTRRSSTSWRELGVDLVRPSARSALTPELAERADVVVTMGCGDACPYIPGKRYVDWDLARPQGPPVDEVRATRDEIARRVDALLAELG